MPPSERPRTVRFVTREELQEVGFSSKHVYRVKPAELQDGKFEDLLRVLDSHPDVVIGKPLSEPLRDC